MHCRRVALRTGLSSAAIGLVIGVTATPSVAEEFISDKAHWVKEGSSWIEYPPYNGTTHYVFAELSRDENEVLLFESTRGFLFRLPLGGGATYWITPKLKEWSRYDQVIYKP